MCYEILEHFVPRKWPEHNLILLIFSIKMPNSRPRYAINCFFVISVNPFHIIFWFVHKWTVSKYVCKTEERKDLIPYGILPLPSWLVAVVDDVVQQIDA